MPHSMMMARATAGILKVSGSSIAIVVVGPNPRQHADDRAEQRADETINHIGRSERDLEAQSEMIEDFHVALPRRQ